MYDNSFPTQLQPHTILLIWLASGWLIWLPGMLLTHLLQLRLSRDVLLQLAIQIALGLAFWPVLFLVTSILDWQWSFFTARINLLGLSVLGLVVLARTPIKYWQSLYIHIRRSIGWLGLFGFIAGLTILTRLLHIRDLVLPNWVDSVTHVMIVRVLLAQGTLPETYAPFIPSVKFSYHWGYHAIVAWLAWLLGWTEPLPIAQLVLHFGQVLNVLTALMLYAAGRVLFNSCRVLTSGKYFLKLINDQQ